MSQGVYFFAVGVLGVLTLSLLKVYEMRGRLSDARLRKTLRSAKFYVVHGSALFVGGIFTWGWHTPRPGVQPPPTAPAVVDLLVTGAASGTLLRQLIAAKVATARTKLGGYEASEDAPATWSEATL